MRHLHLFFNRIFCPAVLLVLLTQGTLLAGSDNVINFFANNNRLVGSPVVDDDNYFRFYPDEAMAEYVKTAVVRYFVRNSVNPIALTKRQDGLYWEGLLNKFLIGHSIQRVEVVVTYERSDLNQRLAQYSIDTNCADLRTYFALCKNDQALLALLQAMPCHDSSPGEKVTADSSTTAGSGRESAGSASNMARVFVDISYDSTDGNATNQCSNKCSRPCRCDAAAQSGKPNVSVLVENPQSQSSAQLEPGAGGGVKRVEVERDMLMRNAAIQMAASDKNQMAYLDNRRGSLLDIRYSDTSHAMIELVYRNDKRSLRYLQAEDPKEKVGQFRVRFVPISIFAPADTVAGDLEGHTDKLIFEFVLSMGYNVVRDDSFFPDAFDFNRLGVGFAMTMNSFDANAEFLALALTYDVNNYSSLSVGYNIRNVDKPLYIGLGINQRVLEELWEHVGGD